MIVSWSSGLVVRGSITSAEMPRAANSSAAASEACTIELVATIVTSSPACLMLATPSGIVYSPSGTSPTSG